MTAWLTGSKIDFITNFYSEIRQNRTVDAIFPPATAPDRLSFHGWVAYGIACMRNYISKLESPLHGAFIWLNLSGSRHASKTCFARL